MGNHGFSCFWGWGVKKIFFLAQSAPNIATPLEKVIPILFQAFNLCKTCFTHRRPVQPPAGT